MIKKLLSLLVMVITASCSCDHESGPATLKGKWKLVAQMVDPGDGSGVFIDVNSEKTLEFLSNATVTSNGSICSMDASTSVETKGTYNETEGSIIPVDCTPGVKIYYAIEGNDLILSYTCIEGCQERYIKV